MLRHLLAGLRKGIDVVIVCLYAFMCIAIFAQVIGRYVFDFSIGAAVVTATFAQIWMVLLAAGVATRLDMHNSVDLFAQLLSRPLYRALLVFSTAACLWFLAVTILGSRPLLEIGEFQTSAATQMPMWIPYLAIPVGCLYFALELILAAVTRWRAGKPRDLTVDEVEGI